MCACSVALVMSDSLQTHELYPSGGSVHGIFQVRVLEWVAMPSSRESSWPRDRTHVSCSSCITGGFFTSEQLGKPHFRNLFNQWTYSVSITCKTSWCVMWGIQRWVWVAFFPAPQESMPSNGFLPWGSPLQPKATGVSGMLEIQENHALVTFAHLTEWLTLYHLVAFLYFFRIHPRKDFLKT